MGLGAFPWEERAWGLERDCQPDLENERAEHSSLAFKKDAAFLLTVGSFLLTVELFTYS